jgi:hypothetical protein
MANEPEARNDDPQGARDEERDGSPQTRLGSALDGHIDYIDLAERVTQGVRVTHNSAPRDRAADRASHPRRSARHKR